jgi:hypothetical protein
MYRITGPKIGVKKTFTDMPIFSKGTGKKRTLRLLTVSKTAEFFQKSRACGGAAKVQWPVSCDFSLLQRRKTALPGWRGMETSL